MIESMNILLPLVIGIILIIVFLEDRIMHSSLMSPWVITNIVWLVINLGLLFYGDMFNPLGGGYILSVVLWAIGFNLFSILSFILVNEGGSSSVWTTNLKVFYFLFVLSLILTPIYLYKIYLTLGDLSAGVLQDLREGSNNGHDDFGLLNRVQIFDQALLIIAMCNLRKIKKWIIFVIIFLNILVSLSIAEKGSILFLLVVISFVLYKHEIIRFKHIVIGVCGVIALFWGMNIARSYYTGSHSSLDSFIMLYILSPSVAFDSLETSVLGMFGENTFPPFYKLCNLLFDTQYEVVSKLKDYTDVPYHVNVYTIMQPFYQDWGYVGVFVFSCIMGVISGFYYKKSLSDSVIMQSLYLFILYVLITQFFQDNFFISISEFFQFMLIFYISSKRVVPDNMFALKL